MMRTYIHQNLKKEKNTCKAQGHYLTLILDHILLSHHQTLLLLVHVQDLEFQIKLMMCLVFLNTVLELVVDHSTELNDDIGEHLGRVEMNLEQQLEGLEDVAGLIFRP